MSELDHIPLEQLVGRLAELNAKLREKGIGATSTDFIPHKPTPKQAAFLKSTAFEACYGGAAGGGKSDALLMCALQYVDVPGYAALILRKTYGDLALPGAIMDRAHDWLNGTGAHWNDRDKRWTFPSGATLTFGFLDNEKDKYRYAGAEVQFLGVDELTQFGASQYKFMLSRIRKLKDAAIPLRARSATNPGSVGHFWVKAHFIDEATRGKREFYPARIEDNPHLDQEGYRNSLAQLDIQTRRQLEDGDWVQDTSTLVYKFEPKRNVITHAPAGTGWTYYLGIDFGFADECAYTVVCTQDNDPTVYVLESWKESGKTPSDMAEIIHDLMQRYEFAKMWGDVGGLGKAFAEEMRKRYAIPIEPARKINKLGYQGLMNGALERSQILIVEATNEALIKELLELPWADESHQREAPSMPNHCCFVAGTRITTPTGAIRIEDVRAGDFVMTRKGPRKVLVACPTGERPTWRVGFSGGHLEGTADHPIFTERGVVSLDSLLYFDRLVQCPDRFLRQPNSSSSTARDSADTQTRRNASCAFTTPPNVDGASTGRSGNITSALSRLASAFTTRTRILSTTISQIWSACLGASMPANTLASLSAWRQPVATSFMPKMPLGPGTDRKQEQPFTPNSGRRAGPTESEAQESASSARATFTHERTEPPYAPADASRNSAETAASMTLIGSALAAQPHSGPIGTSSKTAAPVLVQSCSPTGSVKQVFNLSVEGEHEYFANGVLVSNCDSLLYVWRGTSAYHNEPAPSPASRLGTPEHWQEQERILEEELDTRYRVDAGREWWEK